MKNYLFATALLAALVGCSKSNSDRMGNAATRETSSATSSTADTTSIRPHSTNPDNGNTISGSGSVEAANSGAAAGSLDTPLTNSTTSTTTNQGGALSSSLSGTTESGQSALTSSPAPAQGNAQSSASGSLDSADGSNPQKDQTKTTPPNSTGDQSNGDLSNRPAGAPGHP